MSYLDNYLQTLKKSVRHPPKEWLIQMGYDLGLFLVLYLGIYLWSFIVTKAMLKLTDFSLAVEGIQTTVSDAAAESFKQFIIEFIIACIILGVFILVAWTLCSALLWHRIHKKKLNWIVFRRFLLVNTVWLIPSILLLYLVLQPVMEYINHLTDESPRFWIKLSIVVFFLIAYLTTLLYHFFTLTPRWSAFKQVWKVGILKIHFFLLPLFTYYTVTMIVGLLVNFLPELVKPFLGFTAFLASLVWWRYYLKEVTMQVSQDIHP